ncbi:MAG: hypothetical protein H6604_03320 [Flavobacteriales bacterium]|nr:hypothetical protein [Flavobacteriales bacterium]
MNKNTKKKSSYNAVAINKVAEMYGFTDRYVRMCLNGDRTGGMADKIIEMYKKLDSSIKIAIAKIEEKEYQTK